jgi:hypothetical protein
LDENCFIGKNHKLAPKWTGSHKVLHLKGNANLEIQLKHNNRKTVVHANRLKPYFVATKNSATFPDHLEFTNIPPMQVQPPPDDKNLPEPEDYSDTVHWLLPTYAEVPSTNPSLVLTGNCAQVQGT